MHTFVLSVWAAFAIAKAPWKSTRIISQSWWGKMCLHRGDATPASPVCCLCLQAGPRYARPV